MTYAAVSDLVNRFGETLIIQLTDRAMPPANVIDEDVAGAALTFADSLIDGFVGATYTLPLPQTPPLLVDLACDIVRYRLQGDQVPEEVRARYDDAMRLLRQIRAGELKLEAAGDEELESALVLTSGPDRRFTRDGMRGF